MKIVKIIQQAKKVDENEIKEFIYRNMSQEMINGLEYDDPGTIERALKMFGMEVPQSVIEDKKKLKPDTEDKQAPPKAS